MARMKHGTLTANAVTTHTLEAYTQQITVTNRSQTGEIYFTVDGSTPVVGGDDSHVCLGSRTVAPYSTINAPTVKLISTGALNYSLAGESS